MLICSVVGARPNFMKMAPVVEEILKRRIPHLFVHTGQHYDDNMSRVFFDELGMPKPDIDLGVGSDTQTRQTASVMVAFEGVCRERRPDLILVGGDVNSTMAVSLVAAKEGIRLGHVEAGLRSFDREMPEEINRVVTDHLSDYLFTTEESGEANLLKEGIAPERIHFVGNCMVDTLKKHEAVAIARAPWSSLGLRPREYALLTLHRPSNVDSAEALSALMASIRRVSSRIPVIFPVHPRTRARLESLGSSEAGDVRLCEPLPYLTFLGLMARARLVLTDSGGIQEETTALGVPCVTLRRNTERPITVTHGTNRLATSAQEIEASVADVLAGNWPAGRGVPLWDGRASVRIVEIITGESTSRREAGIAVTREGGR
ncbi:MAG TPA: UDP-N-acetylglucosamine 2-epimerase (non-hydrolyzing) [Thermoanaerobaculia bacterium]|jgi:UDP-N-acetylglucosamine 2-epimerase (non-hydrolysing)|nr:UDP-N-acetylglucosamine 2-epimerase (non-hydrolyzing) [Thermoanaerobaculia bacterium]